MVADDDPLSGACVAFLSTMYPILGEYPSDIPLHECEIKLTNTETSGQGLDDFSDRVEGIFLGRRKVAMKALCAHDKEEVMQKSRLDHSNVLPFIGWCMLDPASYMVSPWMENDVLAYVEQNPQANRLLLVADGLQYLHTGIDVPVIHGDLKTANIFIPSTGVEKPQRYPTEWYCPGSPRWQAPELLSASSPEEAQRTKKMDSFAYGRVMLAVGLWIRGSSPSSFADGDSHRSWIPFFYLSEATPSLSRMVLDSQFPERPLDKDAVERGLDDRMWALMKRCWSVDPKQRPSAVVIFDHLKAALRGHPDNDSDFGGSAENTRPDKRAKVAK
ncbi:hypothetical protein BOTBODRAFT_179023 [Botryobasidium botryosum FD-172 SS1]|uniref:Protein kinase domain-containing protein n=1 Tax=Botryobasidium botryosum (strain FD-172 SS1) TaxID=930990 RepID=A0A067M146_BOTB1|nr:hypothetical protein BOTBODRAFT_179023 [Botryobasidium botryosum FD-172 SS1]